MDRTVPSMNKGHAGRSVASNVAEVAGEHVERQLTDECTTPN